MDGKEQYYNVPLAASWETINDDPFSRLHSSTVARIRSGRRVGVVYDALTDQPFTAAVLKAIRDGSEIGTASGGRIAFTATKAFGKVELSENPVIERMGGEQSNTSMKIGDEMILKAYRRIEPGIHPELEIGRFLTDVAGFENTPPLFGAVESIAADGTPMALAVLSGFVRNQGDGWAFTQDHLHRVLLELEIMPADLEPVEADPHAMYFMLARTLGTRVGELHQAFALDVEDPAFRPERVTDKDLASWTDHVRRQAALAHEALTRALEMGALSDAVREEVAGVLEGWARIERLIGQALPKRLEVMKTRHHGDLHLGQVVVVRDDFYILDFEGEPVRSMEERRAKNSPLRDVAGMVRSFDYAASTALLDHTLPRPGTAEELQAAVQDWQERSVGYFLEEYRRATEGCPSVPAEAEAFDRLLDLFILEKALYEICYEAANRPQWLPIPLKGVRRLLEAPA
jgi:maltose alpha-D-glucosyltransferase/alpha-amylase